MSSNKQQPESKLFDLPLVVFLVAVLKIKLNRAQVEAISLWLGKHNRGLVEDSWSLATRIFREGNPN